jgi:hypothetical protein
MFGAGVCALSASLANRMRRALGQRDAALAADDLLDLLETGLVVGQDRVADELLLLELADHVAVVGRGDALLARHERGDRLHLVADLHESDARALGDLGRGNVDAHLLEPIGVELLGQAEVLARARHELRLQELVVRGDLGLEGGVGRLVARDLVLLEQLGDAAHVEAAVAHVLLDLRLHRALQAGDAEPLARRVGAATRRSGRLPGRRQPRIPKKTTCTASSGDLKLVASRSRCCRARRRISRSCALGISLGGGRFSRSEPRRAPPGCALAPGLEIEDRRVEAVHSELARALGGETREHVDQHAGVGVALLDPGRPCRRLCGGRSWGHADERERQGRDDQAGPELHGKTSLIRFSEGRRDCKASDGTGLRH